MTDPSSTAKARPVRLLQLTDPHLFADPATEIYGVRTAESFHRTLQQALAEGAPPDAILVTGDIGDDLSEAAYRRFREVLEAAGVPVYCLAGNHDDPARMAPLLAGGRFQFGGRARLGAWGLALVDSHVPGEPHGLVSPAAFARLEGDLHVLRDLPVLLAVHHPPVPVGSPWIDAVGLRNAAELLTRLERFPNVQVIVSGHVHQAFDARRGTLRLLTTPSTCAQFTPRTLDCAMDTRPPGYRWLHLAPGGRFDTEVKWLEGWAPQGPVVDSRAGGD
jgi:Icc protein